MKKILSIFLLLLLVAIVGVLSFLFFFKFEGNPPVVEKLSLPKALGKEARLELKVADNRSGIREISIFLEQNKKIEKVFEKKYEVDPIWGSSVKEADFEVTFSPFKLGFKDGQATLIIKVVDASWRNKLKGNWIAYQKKVLLDLTSPHIVVKSPMHYFVPGGSNLVVYSISEPVVRQGIMVDNLFFKGYPDPKKTNLYYCLVAIPLNKKRVHRMYIEAQDEAGNKATFPVAFYLKSKKYRRDVINISDRFLERKIPEFWDRYPQIPRDDMLKAFIYINTELRKENNKKISEIAKISQIKEFYGYKFFLQLPKSATRALFGDYRTYYYKGKKIGNAYHMGIDLASVAGAPVPAAASGKVVFADYLGIYGNTIIIDHGYGLFSLYAHLSGFTVAKGDMVKRGQLIGYTDTTGLAGGDHLHFSVLVQGVFVEPLEWFDPNWVKTRIAEKLENNQ
ncbi:Peptidase M23 [Thermodesulfatator indicus DSM 15286]|uniref:Peptidase M23 n=1 Tax=Thermodesulfatator indicus (strain DSM 15286 / JCM 11887 / CIR29812) TaxID=667014 RepID=F8A999_THEID|nr:M23 family metallopeptidase [Thermodesulfatator indicus]AEH45418.1 Peptidase M23 [Thermodesulfatator indicus DSM 15286]